MFNEYDQASGSASYIVSMILYSSFVFLFRIRQIIPQLVTIGKTNITVSCHDFLVSTLKCLKVLKEDAEREVEGKQVLTNICLLQVHISVSLYSCMSSC